ncbi:uncharacterized protein LY89DRAFT_779491 [Mollisia scopiformis]|uniref:2EXR domain-containing protein n=1 Tax=Mollisia scopiformis TaxID=149040 RepID=A0A194XL16_MOLSC|nr:uncharacterized protein LY89DRAFT_779491 [Mollisia scopiformis]KUJ20789.1 hypothetical protein LY89DRAFT_779491 [Mollisia scopiformis]
MASTSTDERNITAQSEALTEFHKFPKLPPELRLLIWKFACPPSNILVHPRDSWDDQGELHLPIGYEPTREFGLSQRLVRDFVFACHDAYKAYMESKPYHIRGQYNHARVIRFGPDDPIFIQHLETFFKSPEWDKLENSEWAGEITDLVVHPIGHGDFDWLKLLAVFKSLKKVRIMVGFWDLSIPALDEANSQRDLEDLEKLRQNNIENVNIPGIVTASSYIIQCSRSENEAWI